MKLQVKHKSHVKANWGTTTDSWVFADSSLYMSTELYKEQMNKKKVLNVPIKGPLSYD